MKNTSRLPRLTATSRVRVRGSALAWPWSVTSMVAMASLAACAGLGPLLAPALSLASSLLGVASSNYGVQHADDLQKLVNGILSKVDASSAASSANVQPPAGSLALTTAILKVDHEQGAERMVAVKDGDVLYDDDDGRRRGDEFSVFFRSNQDAWVYVLGVDATGWVDVWFPGRDSQDVNPVTGGRGYQLPTGSFWYALDEHRGVETFVFLASRVQRDDLETIIKDFNAKVRKPVNAELRRMDEPAILSSWASTGGSVQHASARSTRGLTQEVTLPPALSGIQGTEVVVSRYFMHK